MRIFLVLIISFFLSSCTIQKHDRYYASNTVLTLTEFGEPVSGALVVRHLSVQGDNENFVIQSDSTDENGMAQFEEYSETGYVYSIGTWVYTHRYYLQEGNDLVLIKRAGKVGHNQLSDTSRYGIEYNAAVNGIEFVIDLDSLDVSAYDYLATDPRSPSYQRLHEN